MIARGHEQARRLLGEPLHFQALKLRDRENVITPERAHVSTILAPTSSARTTCSYTEQVEEAYLRLA